MANPATKCAFIVSYVRKDGTAAAVTISTAEPVGAVVERFASYGYTQIDARELDTTPTKYGPRRFKAPHFRR